MKMRRQATTALFLVFFVSGFFALALVPAHPGRAAESGPLDDKTLVVWASKADDLLGKLPVGKLFGASRVENGKLVLDGAANYAVFRRTAEARTASRQVPAEEFALNYHLMHPGGDSLPGDPNAAFFLDGVCHLRYILAHPWRGRPSFSFVHVTSPDMLHWTWQPTTLQPSFTDHGMFSGTGFLTKDGRPAAIYHGQGSGRNQIAIAKDRALSAWDKPFPIEVKKADGSDAQVNHWDPDCFLIGDTYYAISGGVQPPLFKSTDLKSWTLVGDFVRSQPGDVTIGEDISCPQFFPIGDKWMLLCISHPLGCRYSIGDWDADAEQFVPDQHERMNWGRQDQPVWGLLQRTDLFAPESVLTPDRRRVMTCPRAKTWSCASSSTSISSRSSRMTVRRCSPPISTMQAGAASMPSPSARPPDCGRWISGGSCRQTPGSSRPRRTVSGSRRRTGMILDASMSTTPSAAWPRDSCECPISRARPGLQARIPFTSRPCTSVSR
ncbi:glycoside hydrolase family 32 protein [bacterium]|nr:glycoside hydrolase family 32 protein [bacterium]